MDGNIMKHSLEIEHETGGAQTEECNGDNEMQPDLKPKMKPEQDPKNCWQQFEDWWYSPGHEETYRQLNQLGIVKSTIIVRAYRVAAFLYSAGFLGFYMTDRYRFPNYLQYLTVWGEILTVFVLAMACFQVPSGKPEEFQNKYSVLHLWKWFFFWYQLVITWNILITVYYWAVLHQGPRNSDRWID